MNTRNKRRRSPGRQAVAQQSRGEVDEVSVEAVAWSGPLPPPSVLQAYEDIVPGAADRLLSMAERQMSHRIHQEERVVRGDAWRSTLGIVVGFFLSAGIIGGGIYLVANDHDLAGTALIGLDLVGLASVFVFGTRARRAERERKAARVPSPRGNRA